MSTRIANAHEQAESGYSLVETVLVLMIVAMFLLVPTIVTKEISETLEVHYFLDQVEKNILACQQTAIVSNQRTYLVLDTEIQPTLHFYFGQGRRLETIAIPEGVEVSEIPQISFSAGTGNVQSYRQFYFLWEAKNQKITYRFLFGKGRFEKIVTEYV